MMLHVTVDPINLCFYYLRTALHIVCMIYAKFEAYHACVLDDSIIYIVDHRVRCKCKLKTCMYVYAYIARVEFRWAEHVTQHSNGCSKGLWSET